MKLEGENLSQNLENFKLSDIFLKSMERIPVVNQNDDDENFDKTIGTRQTYNRFIPIMSEGGTDSNLSAQLDPVKLEETLISYESKMRA